ncbi:alpha-L-fucosidase [Aegicerativicinus sediminis]|uniref:alpha-L-fucosidase n=1 Tax=Aegicerativicinus sediminis TaxID=2893202 RepID=UPI001E50FAF1|nr:alpha-L-fucosidase [Aegicerativicinus sediminis]
MTKYAFLIKSTAKFLIILLFISNNAFAQAVYEHERYVPETDPLVLKKLEEWQDLKFGLLMHWGPYSQWGIVESWSLCPEEYGWCERKKGSNPDNYFEYKKEYENLQKTFNPVNFEPEKWAEAAKNAGMKYVVFTTKHHDGFSMFDSKYTDYKITDEKTPFSKNPRANVTKEIFNAFRGQGLWAGAYFSKPDWHHPAYWYPYFPPKDRNVNYSPEENPERWNEFVEFTHNQILELLTDYGKVDILWLDGGWVAKDPKANILNWYEQELANTTHGYLKHRMVNQDIRMDDLVVKARKKQPGLIVVDRAVYGKNQNYLTPENRVPEAALPYPWESCIIAGGGWSYSFDAKYMSTHKAVHTLVDIVAKGGNLLLNIAPSPKGEWDGEAYQLLENIGKWMDVNSEAIYSTEAISPYKSGKVCITSKPKENSLYLIYLMDEDETNLPNSIQFLGLDVDIKKATLLGSKGTIKWTKKDGVFTFLIPKPSRKKLEGVPAFTVRIETN